MSTIDNYGEFDLPEEKSTIEIVEDPVKVILACYDVFQRMKTEAFKETSYPGWSPIYNFAVKTFKDKEKLKPFPKDIEQIFKNLKADSSNGFFVSALHNTLNFKTMIANFKDKIWIDDIGYRLKEDKNLIIIDSNARVSGAEDSQGNIINYGQLINTHLASGLLVNYGEINLIDFVSNGIHINNKKIHILYYSDDIRYINNADHKTRWMAGPIAGPIAGNVEKGMIFYKNKLLQQNQKLQDTLAEIKFLETFTDLSCEKQVELVDNFNFKKFKTDIEQIVQEIYERNR